MSFSQIQLLGNLGKDPELQVTSDGTPYCRFNIAVSKKRKDKEETTWYSCTAWRGAAETIEKYVAKGQTLFVQGDLQVRSYTTKDGKSGVSLDVQVEKWTFGGGGSKRQENGGDEPTPMADDAFLPDL